MLPKLCQKNFTKMLPVPKNFTKVLPVPKDFY